MKEKKIRKKLRLHATMGSDAKEKKPGQAPKHVLVAALAIWLILGLILLFDGAMAPNVPSSTSGRFRSSIGNSDLLQQQQQQQHHHHHHHDDGDAAALTASAASSGSSAAATAAGAPAAAALSLSQTIAATASLDRRVLYRYGTRYWLEPRGDMSAAPLTFAGAAADEKYVSFEPWQGGFNNERMSLEQAAALAILLDRTLVLPPKRTIYLRGATDFTDYFDLADMRRGLRVVTFDTFSKRVNIAAHAGKKAAWLHKPSVWRGIEHVEGVMVFDQKKIGGIGSQVVLCDPSCPHRSANERFKNFASRLKKIDVGTPEVKRARILHFPNVLLGHFYTFVWAEEPERLRHIRAVIKNAIHFRADIFERAERIVDKLGDFEFSALHVRRNDFQFKETWTSAEEILKNTAALFRKGETIYIATDELSSKADKQKHWSDPSAMVKHTNEHAFFDVFKKRYKLKFLSDYHSELLASDTPKYLLGCIDTIVCSRARTFVGTYKSTFTGYIHRAFLG